MSLDPAADDPRSTAPDAASAPEPGSPAPVDTPPGSDASSRRHPRINHGACGKWWTGPNRGHCGQCHETFMPGAFDKHQRIRDGVITCSTEKLYPLVAEWGVLWAQNPPGDGTGYWATRKRADNDTETGSGQG